MKLYVSVSKRRQASRMQSLSAQLATVVNQYIATDKAAHAAQVSAEQAQAAYPRLVKRLGKIIEAHDFDYKIFEFMGYKHGIDDSMSDFFKDKVPSKMTHAVVVVGAMAIDPCRLRLGTKYPLPFSYMLSQAHSCWTTIVDRTHLIRMTREEINYRLALIKKGIAISPEDAEDREDKQPVPQGA